MNRGLLVLLALLAGIAVDQAAAGSQRPPRPIAELAPFLDSLAAGVGVGRDIPGMSISIRYTDGGRLDRAWGFADLESRAPITPRTVFLLGSVAKQMTAAGVVRLAGRGRISLDDPISAYVPDLPSTWNGTTLHHLLHQTSGLCEFLKLPPPSAAADGRPESAADSLIALVARQPAGFAPGSRWAYSNSNYTLLARVIERTTGRLYDDFLRDEFFAPIGVPGIRHGLPGPTSPFASPYAPGDTGPFRVAQEDMNTARGDGGLHSTAPELATWGLALLDGRSLKPAEWATMITPRPLTNGETPDYACGLSRVSLDGRPKVAHDGAISGYTTVLALYPEEGLVIAVMTNRAGAPINTIEKAIARRFLGLPTPVYAPRPVDTDLLERMAGAWEMGVVGFPIEIQPTGMALRLDMPRPGPSGTFHHVGSGRFVIQSDPDEVQLEVVDAGGAGRIERLQFLMGGLHWDLRRVGAAPPR